MGCASSAPLVEQGKHLVEGVKDAANDTMAKGEKAIHDTTGTIKDGVSTGIDSVKDTVQTALNTAEESVGAVAHKIGETFNFSTSKTAENLMANNMQETKDHISSAKEDILGAASDSAAEAVSEAETVIVSETDHVREAFQSGTSPFFETVHSLDDELESTLHDLEAKGTDAIDGFHKKAADLQESGHQAMKKGTEVLEDLETDSKDLLGETVQKVQKTVEELHHEHQHGEGKIAEEEEESHRVDKEDLQPTFWEAAADAILMKKTLKHLEPPLPPLLGYQERIFFPPPGKPDLDSSEKSLQENDIVVENTDN